MNPIINQLIIHTLPVTYDNWLSFLGIPPHQRPFYEKNDRITHISQVTASFIGIPLDDNEYYNQLYDYVHSHELILLNDQNLNNSKDHIRLKTIEEIIQMSKEQSLSPVRLVTLLEQEQLLPVSDHILLNQQIKNAAIKMIELYTSTEKRGLSSKEFSTVLADVMGWGLNELHHHIKKANPDSEIPAFLWYGNYQKSHQYLLFFLTELGFDLVTFTPAGNDALSIAALGGLDHFTHVFPETRVPERFPTEIRKQTATVAYRASKQIERILNHEGSFFYKPWQLREYIPSVITLKTTYDELFLVAGEKAMFRPYFDIQRKNVRIPALFAKINGVTTNRREYWKRLHRLLLLEQTFLIKSLPVTSGSNSDFRFHYHKSLDNGGLLDPQKMADSHYWKYNHLPEGLQIGIGSAIRNICSSPQLKPQNSEREDDVKVYLFTQAMQIPENILKILQKFDYSQEVPKLLIYNNELNGSLTRADASLLLLLNQFGLDLIIYNPAGHSDIEKYIDKSAFVSHWLEEVVFELELKEPSVMKKIFYQGIKSLRRDYIDESYP